MMETVVVTVSVDQYAQDYELPCNVPLEELYPRIRKVLQQETAGMIPASAPMYLEYYGNKLIDLKATLTDYGVSPGSILTVRTQKGW